MKNFSFFRCLFNFVRQARPIPTVNRFLGTDFLNRCRPHGGRAASGGIIAIVLFGVGCGTPGPLFQYKSGSQGVVVNYNVEEVVLPDSVDSNCVIRLVFTRPGHADGGVVKQTMHDIGVGNVEANADDIARRTEDLSGSTGAKSPIDTRPDNRIDNRVDYRVDNRSSSTGLVRVVAATVTNVPVVIESPADTE